MYEELFSWDEWVSTFKGGLHFGFALIALVLGAIMLMRPKGTKSHRILGTAYVIFMVVINVSALSMHEISGQMTLFHAFAILSLATLTPGYVCILLYKRRRHPLWLELHRQFITWSYFGLVAAGVWQVGLKIAMSMVDPSLYGTLIMALNVMTFLAAIPVFLLLRRASRIAA